MAHTSGHNLQGNPKARRSTKRIGRGDSKGGNYSGRGIKGQRARTGGAKRITRRTFMQNLRNVPKLRGFLSPKGKSATITTGMIEKAFAKDVKKLVTPRTLLKKELLETQTLHVKIVVKGALTIPITVNGCAVSTEAKAMVEKAGGTIA